MNGLCETSYHDVVSGCDSVWCKKRWLSNKKHQKGPLHWSTACFLVPDQLGKNRQADENHTLLLDSEMEVFFSWRPVENSPYRSNSFKLKSNDLLVFHLLWIVSWWCYPLLSTNSLGTSGLFSKAAKAVSQKQKRKTSNVDQKAATEQCFFRETESACARSDCLSQQNINCNTTT